jgi:hypothetical protein
MFFVCPQTRQWVATVLAASTHLLPSFTMAEAAGCLHALARLNVQPGHMWTLQLLDCVVLTPHTLHASTLPQLSVVVWSLAKLKIDPGEAVLGELCDATVPALQHYVAEKCTAVCSGDIGAGDIDEENDKAGMRMDGRSHRPTLSSIAQQLLNEVVDGEVIQAGRRPSRRTRAMQQNGGNTAAGGQVEEVRVVQCLVRGDEKMVCWLSFSVACLPHSYATLSLWQLKAAYWRVGINAHGVFSFKLLVIAHAPAGVPVVGSWKPAA